MIKSVKEAYTITRKIKGYQKAKVCYCREDEQSYFFTYSTHGLPVLRVYKEDGHTEEILFGEHYESKDEKIISLEELR